MGNQKEEPIILVSVSNNLDQLQTTQLSYLLANVSSAGTTVLVKNINPFSVNSAIQLGKTGESQSEVRIPQGTASGGTINLTSALLYDHSLDTSVFDIHYDQIIFKRSTVGTAGTATAIGTSNITPNSEFTDFDDTSGAATYAYKTQFLNSVSGDLSSESDWFIPGGPTFYSLQKLRQRGKDALYNANYLKSDDILTDWISEWGELMTNAAIKVNKGYSIGTVSYAFGTSGYGTITEAGFKVADKIEVTTDGVTYTPSTEIPMNQYSESDNFSSLAYSHSWEGDNRFRILPFGALGTARFSFSKINTPLVNDADELPLSLRSYTTGCIEYLLYRAYDNDNKDQQADKHYGRFQLSKNDFINEITPRDQTGPKYINLAEPLSADDTEISADFI